MSSFASDNFRKVDENFCVDGAVTSEHASALTLAYHGVLYLCTDDSG
jgi:hypothetical protein